MGWGGKIGGTVAVLLVGGFFYYLWAEADRDKQLRLAQQAEYEGKAKAERDAAARLLADPVATKAEIDKRLASWITAKDDVYILEVRSGSGRQLMRTIPRTRTWSVTCIGGTLAVEFPTLSDDEEDFALKLKLLPGKLDDQQCRDYVELVAGKMGNLTRAR